MRKLVVFLTVAAIVLVGCGEPIPEVPTETEDPVIGYNLHLIGGPAYVGWFDNIRAEHGDPAQFAVSTFYFHDVDSVFDAKSVIDEVLANKKEDFINIVLIALGPDDYEGNAQEDAFINLDRNKDFINEVKEKTLANDFILMIGNGYPKSEEKTGEFLLWNHEEMRLFLKLNREDTNDRVYNFSVKRALGTSEGYINSDMIDEEGNLNEKGFIQLDEDLKTYLGLIVNRL